jgi:hypothetical protein
LDRGLVTRFVLVSASNTNDSSNSEQHAVNSAVEDPNQSQNKDLPERKRSRKQTLSYYVRTSQQAKSSSRSSRSHHATTAASSVQGTTSYEVRLTAWNCSCPAFAFAAFPPDLASEDSSGREGTGDEGANGEIGWRFGGLTRGDGVPACKHLLACVIAEHCGGFEGLVEEKEVSVGEVAGWAAGWGD